MTIIFDPSDPRTCLNGWWDFHPDVPENSDTPPSDAWESSTYLVPSFWTIPEQGVRRVGDTYFRPIHQLLPNRGREVWKEMDRDHFEFLFDAFGYPPAWSASRGGWARRDFVLERHPAPHRRLWLRFEALGPRAIVYVNGREVARHCDHFLPLEVDITEAVKKGVNQLTVRIDDFERDAKGRAKTPCGNEMTEQQSGIWQDVWLCERGDVRIHDLTTVTSVRKQQLNAGAEIVNQDSTSRSVRVELDVIHWCQGRTPTDDEKAVLELGSQSAILEGGDSRTLEWSRPWPNPDLWSPGSPRMYWLRTRVFEGNALLETRHDRFGFREIWIEGPHIMLNGFPMHMFSDWGHKMTQFQHTETWIRQWFGMIRDNNMNHARLHTHPHPPLVLDLADELGILITGETGLHGSGGGCAADSPEFWNAAEEHVRNFIRRDKNHPCLVMWSVENEMRWNRDDTDLSRRRLPELRKLFKRLDPSRPAYHDGDSSLWNEHEQEVISRHYGKECSGIGWWDRRRPLHSGEMSLYHYQGPNNTCHLGGDAPYASFAACDRAAAEDTERTVEAGRTLGVCAYGPWNQSCLENLRPSVETVKISHPDWSAPGVKPLQVPPHSSEFEFWLPESKGYTPHHSFNIQKRAFRPFAVIDLSCRSALFAGDTLRRRFHVVNDLEHDVEGELQIRLSRGPDTLFKQKQPLYVKRGRVESRELTHLLPDSAEPGEYLLRAEFSANGKVLDRWNRPLRLALPPHLAPAPRMEIIAVFGPGSLSSWLTQTRTPHEYIREMSGEMLKPFSILLLERDTVKAGSPVKAQIRRFIERGGRVILLEQRISLFEDAPLIDQPVQTAFRRASNHPLLKNIDDADLLFWGDDPYALLSGDSFVAHRLYRKNDCRQILFLADSGEGSFGWGDLDKAALLQVQYGQGILFASQFRLSEKALTDPAADTLLRNLLCAADCFRPEKNEFPRRIQAPGMTDANITELAQAASRGAMVLVEQASESDLMEWSRQLGIQLEPVYSDEVYQAVRARDDVLLDSISNFDTCGITTWTYSQAPGNFRCGSLFLKPNPAVEALLVSPTESCLYELFEQDGKSEPLRAHTVTRFLYFEKPPQLIVLGRVRHGAGQIIFNQFAPPPEAPPHLHRLSHRLRSVFGAHTTGSPLDGDRVPPAEFTGTGQPDICHTLNRVLPESLNRDIRECLKPRQERMAPSAIFSLVEGWQTHKLANGTLSACGFDPTQQILVYYRIQSPGPRKNVETNLGVPNPEALTFLDLQGDGSVEITVNEYSFPPLRLDPENPGTVSDIPLEAGFNQIWIVWRPVSADSSLSMLWRDIMRRPESGLKFL